MGGNGRGDGGISGGGGGREGRKKGRGGERKMCASANHIISWCVCGRGA